MKCVIYGRKIKYEDGEFYWWYSHNQSGAVKNPRWRIFKQSNCNNKNKIPVYKSIMIMGKRMKVHRVMYYIHNPKWDIYDNSSENLIDHIDQNGMNNNIENLRIATHSQNMWNRSEKNYRWDGYSWRVRIHLNNKSIHGGMFKNEEDAIKRVQEMKKEYHTF